MEYTPPLTSLIVFASFRIATIAAYFFKICLGFNGGRLAFLAALVSFVCRVIVVTLSEYCPDTAATMSEKCGIIAVSLPLFCAAFCIIFGGSILDAVATFFCGLLLGAFMTFVASHMSRLMGNFVGGLIGGLLCVITYKILPFGLHLPNMIIGTIIALVPGVPFTNGMRDLANEAYIAGTTRLTDAFLSFLGIALGVSTAFVIQGGLLGSIIQLGTPEIDPLTSHWVIQLAAAFVGTMGFAVIFGVPRKFYLDSGFIGMIGWGVYIFSGSAFIAAFVLSIVSYLQAHIRRCPVTVFLICGIIPLVPGGGIFWTAYHIVVDHLRLAASTGFEAIKVTVAIAAAIIIVAAIFNRLIKRKKQTPSPTA